MIITPDGVVHGAHVHGHARGHAQQTETHGQGEGHWVSLLKRKKSGGGIGFRYANKWHLVHRVALRLGFPPREGDLCA